MDIFNFTEKGNERIYILRRELLERSCDAINRKSQFLQECQQFSFIKQILNLRKTLPPLTDEEKSMAIDIVLESSVYEQVDRDESESMPDFDYVDQLVKYLLKWYKEEFFKWVNKPDCAKCDNPEQDLIQALPPIYPYKPEHFQGKAYVIERYKCLKCLASYEFPRYNDICTLLKERKGRCGEWNNCFIAILRSLDIDVRYLWNAEDHVWCEYYSSKMKRWIHLDSCENSYDKPLLYNEGWRKKMSYVFAISSNYIIDVSDKYLCKTKPELHLPRDKAPEFHLKTALAYHNASQISILHKEGFMDTTSKLVADYYSSHPAKVSESQASTFLPPRQSGEGEWTKIRGEDGNCSDS